MTRPLRGGTRRVSDKGDDIVLLAKNSGGGRYFASWKVLIIHDFEDKYSPGEVTNYGVIWLRENTERYDPTIHEVLHKAY